MDVLSARQNRVCPCQSRVRKAEQKKLSKEWRKFCKHSRKLLCKRKDKLKEEEKEQLRIILGLSARLEISYDLKQDFLEFMHSPNSETARERLSLWLFHAENSHIPEFDACIKALHNWSEYILNSYYNKFGQESRTASPAFFPSHA